MDRAAEMDQLNAEVRACTRCPLYQGTTHGVPGEGPLDARIMLVGEAPGQREDQQGRPFVGPSGQWLNELLGMAGLKRDDVYITNIVKHRPPNNRDPQPDEIAACQVYVERQLAIIDPEIVITLGRHSMGWFCGPGLKITQVHGRARRAKDRVIVTMYHPAAALHNPDLKDAMIDDFSKLPRLMAVLAEERVRAQAPADEPPPSQLSLF